MLAFSQTCVSKIFQIVHDCNLAWGLPIHDLFDVFDHICCFSQFMSSVVLMFYSCYRHSKDHAQYAFPGYIWIGSLQRNFFLFVQWNSCLVNNNNNNTYIFYRAIPRWASSVCLFTYMHLIYTIYILIKLC